MNTIATRSLGSISPVGRIDLRPASLETSLDGHFLRSSMFEFCYGGVSTSARRVAEISRPTTASRSARKVRITGERIGAARQASPRMHSSWPVLIPSTRPAPRRSAKRPCSSPVRVSARSLDSRSQDQNRNGRVCRPTCGDLIRMPPARTHARTAPCRPARPRRFELNVDSPTIRSARRLHRRRLIIAFYPADCSPFCHRSNGALTTRILPSSSRLVAALVGILDRPRLCHWHSLKPATWHCPLPRRLSPKGRSCACVRRLTKRRNRE